MALAPGSCRPSQPVLVLQAVLLGTRVLRAGAIWGWRPRGGSLVVAPERCVVRAPQPPGGPACEEPACCGPCPQQMCRCQDRTGGRLGPLRLAEMNGARKGPGSEADRLRATPRGPRLHTCHRGPGQCWSSLAWAERGWVVPDTVPGRPGLPTQCGSGRFLCNLQFRH